MNVNHMYIGMDHAKTVLLNETRTRREDAVFTEAALENDATGALYHVLFNACGMDYECYVDAITAEVRGLFSEPQEETPLDIQVCA